MALRAALWTIGTSGKVLYDCKRTALDLYRNLVSTEVSTNNNKIVLLFVLLYCPGSTVPGTAKTTGHLSLLEPYLGVRFYWLYCMYRALHLAAYATALHHVLRARIGPQITVQVPHGLD